MRQWHGPNGFVFEWWGLLAKRVRYSAHDEDRYMYWVVDESGRDGRHGRVPDWEPYWRRDADSVGLEIRDRSARTSRERAMGLAQAHLFQREHKDMTTTRGKCPICDSPIVNRDASFLGEGTLAEATESCLECKLYSEDYAYGVLRETIAFVPVYLSYAHEPHESKPILEWRRTLIDEARRFWTTVKNEWSWDATALYKSVLAEPEELTIQMALSEWLMENEFLILGRALCEGSTNRTVRQSLDLQAEEGAVDNPAVE